MLKPFVVLFAVLCSIQSIAQYHNGYIVTSNLDTIACKIHEKSGINNKSTCFVKLADGSRVKYKTDELHKFFSQKTGSFLGQKIEKRFVKEIVSGELSLYKTLDWKPKYIFNKDSILVISTNPSDDVVFHSDNKLLIKYDHKLSSILKYITQECPQLNIPSFVKSNDYSVADWVMKYNNCMDQNSVFLLPKKKNISVHVLAKYEYSSVSIDFIYKTVSVDNVATAFGIPYSKANPSSAFGIGLELGSPIIMDNLFLQFEFEREKYLFTGEAQREFTTGIRYNEYRLNQTIYTIPIFMKFRLMKLPLEVYLEGGYIHSINQFSESYQKERFEAFPPFISRENEGVQDLVFPKTYTGIMGGLSLEKKIAGNLSIGAFYRYRSARTGESNLSGRVVQSNLVHSVGMFLKY